MLNKCIDKIFDFNSKIDLKYSKTKTGFMIIYFKNLIAFLFLLGLAAVALALVIAVVTFVLYIFVNISNFLFLISPFTDVALFYTIYFLFLFMLFVTYVFTKETIRSDYED